MKNSLHSIVVVMLSLMIASCQSQRNVNQRLNKSKEKAFIHAGNKTESNQIFHVFTNYEQMKYFFKAPLISDANAIPAISSKHFVNNFAIVITNSSDIKTKPVITNIETKNNKLYVSYKEITSTSENKYAYVLNAKKNYEQIVFVNDITKNEKVIHYNDTPPTITKIVLSYMDLPKSETYKHEYQISIDEAGEVFAVKDENGQIVNQTNFVISPNVFENLKDDIKNLENGGERIERQQLKGKTFKEILLLDDSNKVVYSFTWDNLYEVNSYTKNFVKAMEDLVPQNAITFNQEDKITKTVVAKN